MTAHEFVGMVAVLTKDGEIREGEDEPYEQENDDCYDTLQQLITSAREIGTGDPALTVASMLSGREWNADTCQEIADTLRLAGYTIEDVGDAIPVKT